MSGKRLLDVAAIFNASRGVAQKHAALRSRQAELYSKTSSLAKALQSQVDRVTKTAGAASFLVSRLNEDLPPWASEVASRTSPSQENNGTSISSSRSTGGTASAAPRSGMDKEHFYESTMENTAVEPLSTGSLKSRQAESIYPFPERPTPPNRSELGVAAKNWSSSENPRPKELHTSDYSVPSASSHSGKKPASSILSTVVNGLDHQASDHLLSGGDKDVLYTRSRHTSFNNSSSAEYKVATSSENTKGWEQDNDNQIGSGSFYDAGNAQPIPATEAVPELQVPEGINVNLFHSPRVAKMLGGRIQSSNESALGPNAGASSIARSIPVLGVDQDWLNVQHLERHNSQPIAQSIVESTEADSANKTNPHSYANPDLVPEKLKEVLQTEAARETYQLRESKVPSSRISRLWNYGGLAAGMFGGVVSEGVRRLGGSGGEGSYVLSPRNMDRLVSKLSRMRGAALKLGQMISFQDSKMLPGPIQEVLQRVQDRADYMPASQRDRVLAANLGTNWRDIFSSFDEMPLAAASIGQVHKAVLKSNGARVAVKIQYPGVADSIDSDLNNLAVLLTASRLLPKGLFLDKTIANARTELAWECDYLREAECGRRFERLLADETDFFAVPKIYPEASGKQVLTMEFMDGIGVTRVQSFSQEQKDWIGTQILRLCLREITEFKFMQTDPNWTNFLYNAQSQKLELLDFGASREYPELFISKYTQLLAAASKSDEESLRTLSIDLGYLSGQESKAMLQAHITSVLTLAEPFLESSPEIYDFKDQTITDRVKQLIPLMIRERLNPPPEETYSLHRKLSGAFLLCARLGSRVPCRMLFANSMLRAGIL